MRKASILNIILLLSCLAILNNCSWGTHDAPANLRPYNLDNLNYDVQPAAGSYGFLFYSSADWSAIITCETGEEEIPEMPTVNPSSGRGSSSLQSLNFRVSENNTEFSRTYNLTIISGDKTLVVVIWQRSDLGPLRVSSTEIILPSLGGDGVINVESNTAWNAQVTDNWFTVSPDSGIGNESVNIVVNAGQNSTIFRTSTFQVISDTVTRIVHVSQHAFNVTPPSNTTVTFDGTHVLDFSVLSSLPWEVSGDEGTWYSFLTSSGQASDAPAANQITIQPNPGSTRTAKITVTNSQDEKQSFTITQRGDVGALLNTNWSGTATVSALAISRTGSMTLTIVDEDNVLVRGYPGTISYLSSESISFSVYISELTYEGFTATNITANFTGTFSADKSSISGTLSGSGRLLGLPIPASGSWQVALQ
ncbi:MAG: hypothetical protein LMBGKNDO_00389 [Bacteroidales bacterium]|jgi:hypothetical protein|nr:hypothetical protein [Bacteroidales bacterium]OQC57989.1 MAG: hypothetical protein BWX52_00650 [Bacteroidetes bacterium ADurb.Bin013]HOD55822.1 BACON domain-containing carbohydrate-binding protein [Bacteroidales bacterium]HQM57917.1 BACON domain-containing carbohydrate-binding protein [Bacteroidales bacterium]